MKKSILLVLVAAVAIVSLGGSPAAVLQPLGTAFVSGLVFLNGRQVAGNSVLLADGDRLQTGEKGRAVVTVSREDGVVLEAMSGLRLVAANGGVAAELDQGGILVRSSHERLREVRFPGDIVSVGARAGSQREYQVVRKAGVAYVQARHGAVAITDPGYATVTEVPEGKTGVVHQNAMWAEAGAQRTVRPAPQTVAAAGPPPAGPAPGPQAPGQNAGKVTAVIPKANVERGTSKIPAAAGVPVQYQDVMRTLARGRARVVLEDGSILNVGSDSHMLITQHNAANQTTELNLQYGRMRAQVVKLVKPGAKFEVRTATAVCGVLGTDFYIEADAHHTTVLVFEGFVKVTPIIAGAAAGALLSGGQTVHAGQMTTAANGTVNPPTPSTVPQVQSALNSTSVVAASAAVATSATRVALTALGIGGASLGVAEAIIQTSSPSAP